MSKRKFELTPDEIALVADGLRMLATDARREAHAARDRGALLLGAHAMGLAVRVERLEREVLHAG